MIMILSIFLIFNKLSFITPKNNPSFPNRYPLFDTDPSLNTERCVNQVRTPKGEIINEIKLRKCEQNNDCKTCSDQDVSITCQSVSDNIAKQQIKDYNNSSPNNKFCMPQIEQCLSPFKKCELDSDCNYCDSSKLKSGDSFHCEFIPKGQKRDLQIGNDVYSYTSDSNNQGVCLPQRQFCANGGMPVWTEEDGVQKWTCDCIEGVFGGKGCQEFIACNNNLLTNQSKPYQTLLINNHGDNTLIGKPWLDEYQKGNFIDPTGSTCKNDPSKTCTKNSDCGDSVCIPNAICRCDGINRGVNNYTYTSNPSNPLMCQVDSCFRGRTIYNNGKPSCLCSGQDAILWEWDKNTQSYNWKGYCNDQQLGNIVIKGDKNKCAFPNEAQNDNAKITGIIPAVIDGNNLCVRDPCVTEDGEGYFDETQNKCICGDNYTNVDLKAAGMPVPKSNPIGKVCMNICDSLGKTCTPGKCKDLKDDKAGYSCYDCPYGFHNGYKTCTNKCRTRKVECDTDSECCDGMTCERKAAAGGSSMKMCCHHSGYFKEC